MPNTVTKKIARNLKELHEAPRTEEISRTHSWVLARSRYSKDAQHDRYSMHFFSSSHALEGITVDNVAQQLGFAAYAPCQFIHTHDGICYSREINGIVDVLGFSEAFQNAYRTLKQVEVELHECGIGLYLGTAPDYSVVGDGHHVTQVNRWLEEDNHDYKSIVVNVETGGTKGWITHYRFYNFDLQQTAALSLLGFQHSESCGQFDFEPCHWRFTQHQHYNQLAEFSSNGPQFQKQFRAQQQYLTRNIDDLVTVHRLFEPFGMSLISMRPTEENILDFVPVETEGEGHFPYDVAISFAGADRPFAAELSRIVKGAGYSVFYDAEEDLWGQDLGIHLAEIYSKRARFCIVLVSPEYASSKWTIHEFDNALSRAIEERGKPYILPIIVRDAEIAGLRSSIGYVRHSKENSIEQIAKQLIQKIQSARRAEPG